ncbi:MAG: hypothetical protein ACK5MN_12415 [Lachnospiraceae bacterium]
MKFYNDLPRNKKEFLLFITIISVISVMIIAPLITCFELGFHLAVWHQVLRILPCIWITVVLFVLLTYLPAEWLTHKIVREGDSFHAVVTINIICTVFLLSILLTVTGTWIGEGQITLGPILGFFYKWPRNFTIALFTELLIAQPFARLLMRQYHIYADAKNNRCTNPR